MDLIDKALRNIVSDFEVFQAQIGTVTKQYVDGR